jgi:hypothetical protein
MEGAAYSEYIHQLLVHYLLFMIMTVFLVTAAFFEINSLVLFNAVGQS